MRTWLLVFLLALPLGAHPAFKYTGLRSQTIQNNGPSARKIDIVLVGDGYSGGDRAAFESDARAAMDELWQVPPFKDYRDRFNVHLVMVESYTSRRSLNPENPDNYAFGSTVNGRDMVNVTRRAEALTAARNAPDVDVLVILTTLKGRSTGGGGGPLSGVVLTRDDYGVLAHELGHGIGKLGDEYDSESKLADRDAMDFPAGDFDAPNLTRDGFFDPKNLKGTIKWKHFLELPGCDPLVGAYQGGFYRSVGVWRPSYRCVMRSTSGASFCPVCHEELVKRFMAMCGERFDDKAYHKKHPLKDWK